MAAISLIDPYSQKAEEIARRQRMAQALQESGSQVLQMPTTPGVSVSPYAGLAKILESGLGAYQEAKAQKDYAALQNEYRDKYNTQLGEMARLISAPKVKGVAGQQAIEPQASVQEPIYATKPENLTAYGSGMGTQQDKDKILGWETTVPRVAGQPAIAPVEARPAGYISAADLQKIDIPEVKQLLMAKYLQQFEPKDIKLGQGDTLYRQVGSGPLVEQAVGKAAAKAAERPIVLGEGQSAYDTSGKLLVAGPAKATKAAESKWEKGQKTVDGKTVYGWYDLAAPNYEASFKAGAVPPAGNTQLIQVTRGGKVYYENPAIVDEAARQAAAIEKEAAPVKKIRMEVTAEDGSTKTVLMDETDPRFAEGFATKGPEWVSITTVNAQGMPEIRQVKKDDAILKTGYVKPLEGFLGQLQAAGVPMDKIRSDPKIRDLVDRYFVKTAGGVAPEDVFGSELRKAELVARLGELNIPIPANIKGLSLSVTPGVLGGAQSASAAPAIAKAPPKINDVVVNGDKKFKFKGGDPNQQSNWVEVK